MATNQADKIDLSKRQLYHEVGTNNRLLSDSEGHLVREMLSHSLQIVDQLDAEILRLQSLRQTETERIERYHQAVSPHKKMPPEVLTKMFTHCVEKGPIGLPRKPHYMNDMPWVLLRICSQWREVLIQAPFVTFQAIQHEYRWRTAHAVFSMFPNSKLDLQSTHERGVCSGFSRNVIMPFAPRITELALSFPGDRDSSSELFPKSDVSFGCLQTLMLYCAAPLPAVVFEILRRSPALIMISILYDVASSRHKPELQ